MSTTTTNYGLIKPGTDDPILVGQLNDNMDTIDTVLKDHSDKIDAAALGIKYKGEVNYYADLPNSAEIGDAYTVKYSGSSGTTPDGTEYVWGTVSGTNQWINFSKDSYTKAEVDALLTLKQNALSSTQLDAVNSGIDSTKVAQIETNKNNILYNTNAGFLRKNFYDLVGAVYTGNGAYNKGDDSITVYTTGGAWKKIESVLNAPSGNYKLQFKISNYSSNGGAIQINTYTNDTAETLISRSIITGNGEYTADVVIPAQGAKIAFGINYSSDTTASNSITVSECMLYSAEISDSTYQPYAMSNAELTAAIQAIQAQLANQ